MSFHRGPKIITDGLVLALDAANPKSYSGTGTVWNDLIGNNNGTLTNGPTFDSGDNGSIVFDNIDDFVSIPNNIGYDLSVSAFSWFKSNGTPTGGYHIIFGGQQLEISIPTSGQIRTGVFTSSRFVSNHGSGLMDGNWHLVGLTFTGTKKTSYIDGLSVGTQTVSGNLVSSFSNRTIGRFGSSTGYYLNGQLSNCFFYNRELTAQEVLQNYNATKSRYGL